MSVLLEFECVAPVDGYEVITFEERSRHRSRKLRVLQPRSERTRRFNLFEINSSAFLDFAQTSATEDGIKEFADRYGPLLPDRPDPDPPPRPPVFYEFPGRRIDAWSMCIKPMRRSVELWKMSRKTGDLSKITRAVRAVQIGVLETDFELGMEFLEFFKPAAQIELFLKEDPLSGSPRLCIRPRNLAQALWAQLLMAIDGNVNLGACVQCRKWFTLEAGRGRSDKEYCSNACRMRAYRKRKVSG
jgi:hypothetical protein